MYCHVKFKHRKYSSFFSRQRQNLVGYKVSWNESLTTPKNSELPNVHEMVVPLLAPQ